MTAVVVVVLSLAGAALAATVRRAPAAPREPDALGPRVAARARGVLPAPLPRPLVAWLERARTELVLAGDGTTPRRFLLDKVVAAVALPAIPLLPYAALTGRLPSPVVAVPLALAGFFVPDLALRRAVRRRRDAILLDLPDALSMLSLVLAAGRSLHQALALAARETGGPLGADIAAALSRSRRDASLDERGALAEVARASGEPAFTRFAELLARKESPYVDFLRAQAAEARAEQTRVLDRAHDRAYLAMHAPLAPLLATLVLLVSYGFLHLLDRSI